MRWPRRVAATLVVAISLGLLPPLVVRGPVLRWAFGRALASRCGHFSIGGGHFGWGTLIQLALGRPFSVVFDQVVINDPVDRLVLEAGRGQGSVRVRFSPLRIDLASVRIANGVLHWVGSDARSISDSFRGIPTGGRSACLAPQSASKPVKGSPVQIRIEDARLEDLDIDLDFPAWQLALARVNTSVRLSFDGGLRFAFARTVVAGGGSLRVGPVGADWTTTAPFDTIVFDSLGTVPEAPGDLVLVLDSARTGRAELSGRGIFHQVLPAMLPNRSPEGLDVEARWRRFGDGLARLQAAWLSHTEWLKPIEHDLQVGIHGPYDDPRVTASLDAAGAQVEAELAHGFANLRLDFAGADTRSWFVPGLCGLLGGRLQGRLLADLRLAPSFVGLTAEVLNADLRLDRDDTARGPQSFVLRIGALQAVPFPSGSLSANIRQLRLMQGRLQLLGARAVWSRLSARAEASIDFKPSDWPGSRIEARGGFTMASIADWIPAKIAQGRLRMVAEVSGTLESLGLQARVSSASSLILGGQRFRLPNRFLLEWRQSRGLLIPPFRLGTDTGFIGLQGRVAPDDRVEGEILLSHYRLAELPWFPSGPVARSFGAVLAGRLLVQGSVDKPSLRGAIRTASLDFRGRSLGAAITNLALDDAGGDGTLRVGPSLVAKLNLRYAPLLFAAEISLHKQALRPWLPLDLSGPPVAATGTAHLQYREGGALAGDAAFEVEGPGLQGVKMVARARPEALSANITGRVELSPWRVLWSPYLTEARGAIAGHLTARRDHDGTRLSGDLLAVQDVTLGLGRRYGSIRFQAGDELGFDGRSLASQGLRIHLPWFHGRVAGRVTMDPSDLSQSLIDAAVAGVLDLGALPTKLLPELSLGGQARIDASLAGTLGPTPGPRIHGHVDLQQVQVKLSDFPAFLVDGRIQAEGERLSTGALDLKVARAGRLTIGTPESPAWAVLVSLLPLRFGQVDAGFSGKNLALGGSQSPVEIRELDVDARLNGPPGARTLSGQVDVSRGSLRPARAKAAPEIPHHPWYQSLPPGFTLDLEIRGLKQAMKIAVPVAPDVTADFDCRVRATRRGAHWSGRIYGAGLYDRMALRLYSWFGDKGLLRCQLGGNK